MGGNKSIIILAVLTILMAAVYFTAAASTDPGFTGYLFGPLKDGEYVHHIELENEYGSFTFDLQSGGYWNVSDGGESYRAHAPKMDLLVAALKDFKLSRVLDELDPQYGLNEPAAQLVFNTTAGGIHAFSVGNEAPSHADNYVSDGETTGVTASANVAQLTGSLTAYRNKEVFTVDVNSLVQLGYYEGDDLALSVARAGDGWLMEYPFEAQARSIEMGEFIEMLQSWTVAGFPDLSSVSREEMQLDGGASLMLVDSTGASQVLTFGASSGTATFVRNGGEDDIVMLYTADIDLSYMDAERLMLVSPLRATVDSVESISIEYDGEAYLFEADSATETARLNGRLIAYEDYMRVFYRYIMVMAEGRDQQGAPGKQAAVLTTVYGDGVRTQVKLLERDDATYFMEMGGEAVYYLPKTQIDDLMERVYAVEGNE